MNALERFINYTKIDTQADDTTGTHPSTEKQKNLGRLLVNELKELGLNDAEMDEYGNVYAHLKGEGDKIGLNAHIDTALEVTDFNVNPKIVKNYNGGDIRLNEKYTLSPNEFPDLKKHIGKSLVVTDGNTLLGADDKAGIAIIMGALQLFHDHPEIKHHNISVAFTCDEEIGEGALNFNYKKMDADYAFTSDGGPINFIGAENFNAYQVVIKAHGFSVHPGEGKNALVNALGLLHEITNALPQNETPYDSADYQGYWMINSINGTSEYAEQVMILRDFNEKDIARYLSIIHEKTRELQEKFPKCTIEIVAREQYTNMKKYVDMDPRPVQKAIDAIKKNGLIPVMEKTRGGTDGATFSKNGLVTPNLGTASSNHHGRYEYLVIEDFYKMIDIFVDILKI